MCSKSLSLVLILQRRGAGQNFPVPVTTHVPDEVVNKRLKYKVGISECPLHFIMLVMRIDSSHWHY